VITPPEVSPPDPDTLPETEPFPLLPIEAPLPPAPSETPIYDQLVVEFAERAKGP